MKTLPVSYIVHLTEHKPADFRKFMNDLDSNLSGVLGGYYLVDGECPVQWFNSVGNLPKGIPIISLDEWRELYEQEEVEEEYDIY